MTPDLNVLLAASRTDHPHHVPALRWLEEAIVGCQGGASLEILPMVAAAFLRLATNRKVFVAPVSVDAAIDFLDSLLAIPGVEMPELGREWPVFKQLSREHNLAANDITDAWIASAVRTLGSHLVTFDRGFARLLGRTEVTVLAPTWSTRGMLRSNQIANVGRITARARVCPVMMEPTKAGVISSVMSSAATSSACTANTYRCGRSPFGGAGPR